MTPYHFIFLYQEFNADFENLIGFDIAPQNNIKNTALLECGQIKLFCHVYNLGQVPRQN